MGTIKRGFANNILTTGKFDATDYQEQYHLQTWPTQRYRV